MTEKRFTAIIYDDYEKSLFFDNERKEQSLTDYEILNLLNELNEELESKEKAHTRCDELYQKLYDENEQLKAICKDRRDHAIDFKADCVRLEKENEELQQFKDKVFELLHKKLEEYPYLTLTEKWDNNCKYKHSCRENHEKNVAYASINTILNKLKKELQE